MNKTGLLLFAIMAPKAFATAVQLPEAEVPVHLPELPIERPVVARPDVIIDARQLSERACYYDDKQYSLGSVLSVGTVLLECVEEKSFEMNGKLRWLKME